jgi:hypothetical protein
VFRRGGVTVIVKNGVWLGAALTLSAAGGSAATTQTQVFKCVDPDGHVVFSDTDCGSAKQKVDVVQSSGGLSATPSSGLSPQERDALNAIDARDAQIAAQRAAAGGTFGGPTSAPAPAPSPSTAPTSSY